jgi:AraC-like ligand binding domain
VNRERASLVTLTNGVLLLEAVFDRHVYERHMHDTYAVGVTLRGVQQFWCGGSIHRSTAHNTIVIPAGEVRRLEGREGERLPFPRSASHVREQVRDGRRRSQCRYGNCSDTNRSR